MPAKSALSALLPPIGPVVRRFVTLWSPAAGTAPMPSAATATVTARATRERRRRAIPDPTSASGASLRCRGTWRRRSRFLRGDDVQVDGHLGLATARVVHVDGVV